ncbi:MAG TPA: hypothetical protein VGO01_22860 [Bradyrhizobium sp.]|jgi:hypothetical protein|nr:hypothetical protein [Bradyrhizobium sp.]
MDAPTATIVGSLIAATGSIIVALIATRGRSTGFPTPSEAKAEAHVSTTAVGGAARRPSIFGRVVLWILYFVTAFFLFGTVGVVIGDVSYPADTYVGVAFIDVVLVGSSLLLRKWLLASRR